MKVSFLQENVTRALGILNRAASTRASMPITQNVLISAQGSFLKLTVNNLQVTMTTWIPAKVDQEGETTTPIRLLNEFIGSLTKDTITMETEEGKNLLNITCMKAQANIHGMDPKDFPPTPLSDEARTVLINANDFRSAAARISPCAATEDSRPVLTGVNITFEQEQFTMAGADGFRLGIQTGALHDNIDEPFSLTIPAKALSELQRVMGDTEEPLQLAISTNNNTVLFKTKAPTLDNADFELTAQLINGDFPNYMSLVPSSHNTQAVFDTKDIMRATRSAEIFAKDHHHIIKFSIENSKGEEPPRTVISSKADEIGNNTQVLDALEMTGDDIDIAFNSRYLNDLLNTMDEEKFRVECLTSTSPAVFKPVDSDRYQHIIMPMFIND